MVPTGQAGSRTANHRDPRNPACRKCPGFPKVAPRTQQTPKSRLDTTVFRPCLQPCYQQPRAARLTRTITLNRLPMAPETTIQTSQQESDSCKSPSRSLCMRKSRASFSVFRRSQSYQRVLPQLPGRGSCFSLRRASHKATGIARQQSQSEARAVSREGLLGRVRGWYTLLSESRRDSCKTRSPCTPDRWRFLPDSNLDPVRFVAPALTPVDSRLSRSPSYWTGVRGVGGVEACGPTHPEACDRAIWGGSDSWEKSAVKTRDRARVGDDERG